LKHFWPILKLHNLATLRLRVRRDDRYRLEGRERRGETLGAFHRRHYRLSPVIAGWVASKASKPPATGIAGSLLFLSRVVRPYPSVRKGTHHAKRPSFHLNERLTQLFVLACFKKKKENIGFGSFYYFCK